MSGDPGPSLCTAAQFTEGPFNDLVTDAQGNPVLSTTALNDFLLEATRMCEDETEGRRLVPFTVTETHRAEGIDPDEYPGTANIPMDLKSTIGQNYAAAIGADNLVRHCWLDQKADKYPDMWQYSNVTVTIIRSYGGTQAVAPTQILNGPEKDTGHMWFQLGMFLPVGSRIQVAYGGGYNPIPASLVRAGKYMTASIIIRELNPGDTRHDPDVLEGNAQRILANWIKDD